MSILRDIERHADPKDKPVLLWLAEHYSSGNLWRAQFLATVQIERYGVLSYEVNKVWTPTREGQALYNALNRETE